MGYTCGPYEVRMTPMDDFVDQSARFLLSNLEAGYELKLARGY